MLSQFADIQEAQGNIDRIDDVFSQTEGADEEDNADDSDNEGKPDSEEDRTIDRQSREEHSWPPKAGGTRLTKDQIRETRPKKRTGRSLAHLTKHSKIEKKVPVSWKFVNEG